MPHASNSQHQVSNEAPVKPIVYSGPESYPAALSAHHSGDYAETENTQETEVRSGANEQSGPNSSAIQDYFQIDLMLDQPFEICGMDWSSVSFQSDVETFPEDYCPIEKLGPII
jgi:hypothetical protein